MPERDETATQTTQPAEGGPAEIPIPTRREFFDNLAKVAPPAEHPAKDEGPPPQD